MRFRVALVLVLALLAAPVGVEAQQMAKVPGGTNCGGYASFRIDWT